MAEERIEYWRKGQVKGKPKFNYKEWKANQNEFKKKMLSSEPVDLITVIQNGLKESAKNQNNLLMKNATPQGIRFAKTMTEYFEQQKRNLENPPVDTPKKTLEVVDNERSQPKKYVNILNLRAK